MSLVLDSNILVKLVTAEPGSKEARTFVKSSLREGYSLYSVDIAFAESLNAIWKHARVHKDLRTANAKSAVHDLATIYNKLNILTTSELYKEALDIALRQNITIYDSLYIAASKKIGATLYTADQKLHNASKGIAASKLLKLQLQ